MKNNNAEHTSGSGNTELKNFKKIKIFLVDDDALFLKSLALEFFEHADFIVETFATAELCIANLASHPDVIILDYFLDSIDKNAMNGIEALDKIKKINPDIPVVIISGAADIIGIKVDSMHHRAFDFVAKSKTHFMSLQKIISSIFRFKKNGKEIELVYGEDAIPFQLSVVSI